MFYKKLFETLYYTGLRQGECLALTWKDFQNDYLDIYKTISKEKVDDPFSCVNIGFSGIDGQGKINIVDNVIYRVENFI